MNSVLKSPEEVYSDVRNKLTISIYARSLPHFVSSCFCFDSTLNEPWCKPSNCVYK